MSNASSGSNMSLLYSIKDNESVPEIQFDTDASNSVSSGNENSVSSPRITVTSNRRSIYDITIPYSAAATDGTATLTSDDYGFTGSAATISAGTKQQQYL